MRPVLSLCTLFALLFLAVPVQAEPVRYLLTTPGVV